MSDSITAGGRIYRVAIMLTWALVISWAVSSLWFPFGWDQGIMAWLGDTILRGGMPYRDAFDIKGPAAHYINALAQALFGHNLWGIRLLDLVGLTVSAWLLADVVRRHTDREAAPWAAAVFMLWFAGLTFWHTAQPDGWASMLLCIGFVPLLRAGPQTKFRRDLWAGLMVGLTVLIKPNYAAFLAVPAVWYWSHRRHGISRIPGHMAVVALSAAATVGLALAWFAYRGALDALIEVHILYNAQAYSSGSSLAVGERLRGVFEYVLTGNMAVIVLPVAAFGAVRLYGGHRPMFWSLLTWAAVAAAGVVLQNKFFDYQWAPLFPPIVILGAVGLHQALVAAPSFSNVPGGGRENVDERTGPGLGHVLFCAILLHASIQPASEVVNWTSYMVGLRDKAAYYDTFGVPGPDYRMVDYIESIGGPEDRLFIMGWNIEILYMTGRETVSRLGYSLPVWMGEGTPLREQYRAELMRDLTTRPPEMIVVAPQAKRLLGETVTLEDFFEFNEFLANQYDPEARFGDLELYVLR